MNFLIGEIKWCDWCNMLCFNPSHLNNSQETVCKGCVDDAPACKCCKESVHPDVSVDMPEGWYCEDCYSDIYK